MYFEQQVKQINLEKKKQLENNQRVKERNVKTAIFNLRIFSSTKKNTEKERCNGCLAAQIIDNRMHIDLTRSITSRHAATVKRVFDRARDPQRMWISRDYHKNETWTKTFLLHRQFLWKKMLFKTTKKEKGFSKKIKKISFFF